MKQLKEKGKEKGKKLADRIRHPRQSGQEQQAESSQAPPQNPEITGPLVDKGDSSGLPPGGSQIPQNLHFFWKGESPGRDDREWPHLQQWGNMGEKSAGWNKTLWTDRSSHDEWQTSHPDKLNKLENMNVNVKPVEEQIDKRNKHVYDYAVNHDARTMASDVARYSVLKNHGGIYADLDIAPGNLSLPNSANQEGREMLSSGRLPLFGPKVRDSKSVETATPNSTAPFEERLKETVDKKYTHGDFGNQLIAAEPNNPTINLAIDKISKLKEGEQYNDLQPDKEHLDKQAPLMTGPSVAMDAMQEQMKVKYPQGRVPQATEHMNPNLKDHLISNIDLLTDASKRD